MLHLSLYIIHQAILLTYINRDERKYNLCLCELKTNYIDVFQ